KRARANDSVRSPHVKVGHRQGFILEKRLYGRFFFNYDLLNILPNSAFLSSNSLFQPICYDF
ncbi:hypothetical protein, partial [Legionella qingyii]